jgi:hypothetical protein
MIKVMKSVIPALLVLSTLLFSSSIPGGPIENRSFSNHLPVVVASFNVFLTALGIGSLFAAYHAWKARRGAFIAAALCGFSYFLVYLLDLFRIFPVSADAMSSRLWDIEIAGSILAVPLILLSAVAAFQPLDEDDGSAKRAPMKVNPWIGFVIGIIALAIVLFATYSAMRK